MFQRNMISTWFTYIKFVPLHPANWHIPSMRKKKTIGQSFGTTFSCHRNYTTLRYYKVTITTKLFEKRLGKTSAVSPTIFPSTRLCCSFSFQFQFSFILRCVRASRIPPVFGPDHCSTPQHFCTWRYPRSFAWSSIGLLVVWEEPRPRRRSR